MTDYQKAVAEHMKNAPVELREYVCERLKDQHEYLYRIHPINHVNFGWGYSEEGYDFWDAVSYKDWPKAIATDFWQSREEEDPLIPISEMEIGQVFFFGTGRWKIVSVENGQAQCERLPDVITLPITQQVPAE